MDVIKNCISLPSSNSTVPKNLRVPTFASPTELLTITLSPTFSWACSRDIGGVGLLPRPPDSSGEKDTLRSDPDPKGEDSREFDFERGCKMGSGEAEYSLWNLVSPNFSPFKVSGMSIFLERRWIRVKMP